MGLTISAVMSGSLAGLLARLAEGGLNASLMMLDGQLCPPGAVAPAEWREARLRTPAGTVTLKRDPAGGTVSVVVFGNASPELEATQQKIAAALAG